MNQNENEIKKNVQKNKKRTSKIDVKALDTSLIISELKEKGCLEKELFKTIIIKTT